MAIAARLAKSMRRLELVLLEQPAVHAVEAEHAGHLTAHCERHDDRSLRLLLLGARHLRDPRVVGHVVDELRLVVARDPAADALVEGHAERQHLLRVLVARVDAHQLARLLVHQADVDGVVVHHLLEHPGDLVEHRRLVQRAEERGAQVQQAMADRQLAFEQLGRVLELRVVARVLDGDRGQVREELGRLELVLVEGLPAHAVERQHPDDLAAHIEGRDDRRLRHPVGARHERAARVVRACR